MVLFDFFKDIFRKTPDDKSKLRGKDFEFLITGDIEIPADEFDAIMTPNSFAWTKADNNGWPYYQVEQDKFSYSWETPGIQMSFNDDITYEKAKAIADEIVENIKRAGQTAELEIVYRFR